METRHFNVYLGTSHKDDITSAIHTIADHWAMLGMKKIRLFPCCQRMRLFLVITANGWGRLDILDLENIFTTGCMRQKRQYTYPNPQKRYTGEWYTYTTPQTLRHTTCFEDTPRHKSKAIWSK